PAPGPRLVPYTTLFRSAVPHDSYGSSVVVPRDARGHFVVDARVDGRRMVFMLDTGASVVALRARDAAGLGIHPAAREFTAAVNRSEEHTSELQSRSDLV